ncbi:MAG: DNA gyrase inhibitor YacG [Deltaproteobacteria bacterium]|nr:DNA gyrase inhibitor YacG [Deltaproteobacteria bacterium]
MKVKCPVCGRITEYEGNPFRPFCSKKCKDIDLVNWADGRYRIPGQDARKDEDDNEGEPE